MKLVQAFIADWVRHSTFGGNVRENPLATGPNGNTKSLSVDSSGMLTAVRVDKEGNARTWLFPPGTWHGEPEAEKR